MNNKIMQKRQIFLMGVGRSGTTLVQRILNTYEHSMVWGEHSGFLKTMAESYFKLKECPSINEFSYSHQIPESSRYGLKYKDPKVWQAWVNWFKKEDLQKIYKKNMDEFFCPPHLSSKLDVWGIKEIRYGADDRVLEYLKSLYSKGVFIFVVRHGLNNLESQLNTFYQGKSRFTRLKRLLQIRVLIKICNNWKRQNRFYKEFAINNKHCFFLRYEDLITDPKLLQAPLTQLGLTLGDEQLNVLSMAEGRGTSFVNSDDVNERWRQLGFIPSFIAVILMGRAICELGYTIPKTHYAALFLSKLLRQ